MVFSAGYPAWKKVEGAGTAVAVKAGGDEGTIDVETFTKILKENPESVQIIDVRDKDEFDEGHFNTAMNMPTDFLEKNVDKISDDKPIVFVCNTGAKSGEAFYMLQELREDLKKVYFLDAETKYNGNGSFTIKKPE